MQQVDTLITEIRALLSAIKEQSKWEPEPGSQGHTAQVVTVRRLEAIRSELHRISQYVDEWVPGPSETKG